MTVQSFGDKINTLGEFETLESITGITFTVGTKYYLCAHQGVLKIANAEIPFVNNNKLIFTQGSEDFYFKTDNIGTRIDVLELEDPQA